MTPRLVPWPRAAVVVFAAAVAIVALLGALTYHDTRGNAFDDAIGRWIGRNIGTAELQQALHLTDPHLVVGLLAAVVLLAALVRRWDVAVLAAIAPVVAIVITEVVLKPLVHRSNIVVTGDLGQPETLAYPSGHETGIASAAAVIALVLLASDLRRSRKMAVLAAAGIVVVLAAVGLVGSFYHYATDTIGAVGVAVATTLGVALVIDRVGATVSSRTREPVREPG